MLNYQRDRNFNDLLMWLSAEDHAVQQSVLWDSRQIGTCLSLFRRKEFQHWKDTPGQVLFAYGIPGAGKTYTSSSLVDYLQTKQRKQEIEHYAIGIAYIYCNYQRHDEQSKKSIFENILKQLISRRPGLCHLVQALRQRCSMRQSRPTFNEISDTTRAIVQNLKRVFIVIDAVDECNELNGTRFDLLNELRMLQQLGANIFITARQGIVNITHHFQDFISVEISATDEDIRRYLNGQTHRLRLYIKESQDLVAEIINSITNAAQGMYDHHSILL